MSLHLTRLISELTIVDKEANLVPFPIYSEFAWAQRRFIAEIERQHSLGKPIRIITLKARQLGISTLCEAILFYWGFLYTGTNALCIAHESEASQSLFEKTKMYWDYWPYHALFSLKNSTQKRLTWKETNSSVRIATARNEGSGRGRTIQALHASECAFWENPETLMTGLNQAIPRRHGTAIFLESTANGIGNWFYQTWYEAVRGENDYVPIFFPAFEHPEYRIYEHSIRFSDLDEYELNLLQSIIKDKIPEKEFYAHIAWRRWALSNLCNSSLKALMQEYPETPEEAFISTGDNVFDFEHLDACYEPLEGAQGDIVHNGSSYVFQPSRNGKLTIYEEPSDDRSWGMYFVGADPCFTTTGGDYGCIQVINMRTLEQSAVWHGRCSNVELAKHIAAIGTYYNNAKVTCEIEGPGYGTIGALLEMGYPKIWKHRQMDRFNKFSENSAFGWSSNYNRKRAAIGRLAYLINERSLTIHDEITYHQLREYSVLMGGELGPSSASGHDDAVSAYAITLICMTTDGPPPEYQTGLPVPQVGSNDIQGEAPWEGWE